MSLTTVLPIPKQVELPPQIDADDDDDDEDEELEALAPKRPVGPPPPPYGQRSNFVPRKPEDYGDGGAYPEILVAQYPLEMGRKARATSQTVPLSIDTESGKIMYDAVLGHHQSGAAASGEVVLHTRLALTDYSMLTPQELAKPSEEEVAETTKRTKEALEKIVSSKISASHPSNPAPQRSAPTYFKYTPSQRGEKFNSGAMQRTVRMVEMPRDPLEPPKFRAKRIPKGPASPPVPVMHSPPKKISAKDQQAWRIPPSISNWKNNKGYTIPLDKRLAADGRGLQDPAINNGFAKLSEALYVAERNAREEVAMRAKILEKMRTQEKEKNEQRLREMANAARLQRSGVGGVAPTQTPVQSADHIDHTEHAEHIPTSISSESTHIPDAVKAGSREEKELTEQDRAKRERDMLREERRYEREREYRMEAYKGKHTKFNRDEQRDVAEQMALGQAPPTGTTGQAEVLVDQRLLNQSSGLDSGFGDDDEYHVYTKPMSSGVATQVYRPHVDNDSYGQTDLETIAKTDRFRPERDFSGVDRSKPAEPHTAPVEFEKEADPFGMDEFLHQVKNSTKQQQALAKIGSGSMHAASSSFGTRDSYGEAGSKRKTINFDEGDNEPERERKSPKRRRK
ncbi:SNW/SKI-interacting protein A [Pelomyxa schiedti]|nr:SNW/SKI-interacting protein A [Pelomyxa schiedti]